MLLDIVLCDDVVEIVNYYEHLVKKLCKKEGYEVKITKFDNGEKLAYAVSEKNYNPSIILLDVLMGQMNGVECAKDIRKNGCTSEIIFLTTSEEYVFESFEVDPVNYLIKDQTSEDKFNSIFLKAIERCESKKEKTFVCKGKSVTKQIKYSDIKYFDVNNRIVTIHYGKNESFEFYATMDELEKELNDSDFMRIHRSYLVHLQFIAQIKKGVIELVTGETLPLGTTYIKKVKDQFSKYLLDSM